MSIATNNNNNPLFNCLNELLSNNSINNGSIKSSSNGTLLQPKSVPCSFIKTNTNIYYNVKVDNSAKKSVHYCLICSNYNCKAIHKSICKSLDNNQQQHRLSLNKTSTNGPNINFIFERRYPQQHSIFPQTTIQVPTAAASTSPILSPNNRNKQQNELNSFPLPLSSPISSTNNNTDFLNLLNLPRSFRNNLLIDQVNAWKFLYSLLNIHEINFFRLS
jgi:hypothetical protein